MAPESNQTSTRSDTRSHFFPRLLTSMIHLQMVCADRGFCPGFQDLFHSLPNNFFAFSISSSNSSVWTRYIFLLPRLPFSISAGEFPKTDSGSDSSPPYFQASCQIFPLLLISVSIEWSYLVRPSGLLTLWF